MKLNSKLAAALLGVATWVAVCGSAGSEFFVSASPQESESDLGCCVLKSDPVQCFSTNRAYCRDRAKRAQVEFVFHKDKACSDLDACRKPSARTRP